MNETKEEIKEEKYIELKNSIKINNQLNKNNVINELFLKIYMCEPACANGSLAFENLAEELPKLKINKIDVLQEYFFNDIDNLFHITMSDRDNLYYHEDTIKLTLIKFKKYYIAVYYDGNEDNYYLFDTEGNLIIETFDDYAIITKLKKIKNEEK